MAFFLFILVNAALFIRPAEVVPGWQGVEIYFYVILACLLASFGDILAYLTDQPLDTKPILLCVLGVFVAVLVPQFLAGDLEQAGRTGVYFAKNVAYFLLFVSLVNTPARLLAVQRWLLSFASVTAALAILCFFEHHQDISGFYGSLLQAYVLAIGTELGWWIHIHVRQFSSRQHDHPQAFTTAVLNLLGQTAVVGVGHVGP